jgi:hypothetical protein
VRGVRRTRGKALLCRLILGRGDASVCVDFCFIEACLAVDWDLTALVSSFGGSLSKLV